MVVTKCGTVWEGSPKPPATSIPGDNAPKDRLTNLPLIPWTPNSPMAGYGSLKLSTRKRKHCSENMGSPCLFDALFWLLLLLWLEYKMSPQAHVLKA